MPDPSTLAKHCTRSSQGVCGPRAQYHLSLVRLGKTNFSLEREAFSPKEWDHLLRDNPVRSPNPVFLYDTQQLADKDPKRKANFRRDIEAYLESSQHSAHWIRTFFLQAPDVYVSDTRYFLEILDSYMIDPCQGHG
jgi:hypothetical protein